MTAFEVLVVILSVFLAIFLILGIAVLITLLRVFRKMDELADKANAFADDFSANVAEVFKKSFAPSAIVSGIIRFARKSRKRKRDK